MKNLIKNEMCEVYGGSNLQCYNYKIDADGKKIAVTRIQFLPFDDSVVCEKLIPKFVAKNATEISLAGGGMFGKSATTTKIYITCDSCKVSKIIEEL